MDYPEALGSMLGAVMALEAARSVNDYEYLRGAVDRFIERAKEIEAANNAHSRGIMERLDAKIKELAK